jgi:hypothetical protein
MTESSKRLAAELQGSWGLTPELAQIVVTDCPTTALRVLESLLISQLEKERRAFEKIEAQRLQWSQGRVNAIADALRFVGNITKVVDDQRRSE